MPSLIIPKLPISWGSDIMPTRPLWAGFHSSLMLVTGVLMYLGFQAMPVLPDAHGTL